MVSEAMEPQDLITMTSPGSRAWLEEDKIVLMDYKTDSVKTPEELLTRYATQLQLYGQALGSVFGDRDGVKKETENLIYSFALDTTISVDDNTKKEYTT